MLFMATFHYWAERLWRPIASLSCEIYRVLFLVVEASVIARRDVAAASKLARNVARGKHINS